MKNILTISFSVKTSKFIALMTPDGAWFP